MTEVAKIMSSPVISICPGMNLQDAAKFMYGNEIHAPLVRNTEKYLGVITDSNFAMGVVGKGWNPKTTSAYSMMSSPIVTIDSRQDVNAAKELMGKH